MRLAMSTALLVSDIEPRPEAAARLIAGFDALDLPVVRIAGGDDSAFTGTGLEAHLEECGILTLVVCGERAHATARDASSLGFRVFLASDAEQISAVEAAIEALRRRRA
jgi:nicotinamidase-related amidase